MRTTRVFLVIFCLFFLFLGCENPWMTELLEPLEEERQARITISIFPELVYVERGTDFQFTAKVEQTKNRKVRWSLDGSHFDTFLSSEGLLQTSLDEQPGTELTVTAVSAQNDVKTASASVVIVDYGDIAGHVEIAGFYIDDDNMRSVWVGQTLTATANINSEREADYQWKRGDTVVSTGSDTYTITRDDLDSNLNITAVVSVIDKYESISSVSVRVVTRPDAKAPVIAVQPVNADYGLGAAASPLSVTAISPDGGTLSYQWYAGISPVPGATNRTYTPPTETAGTINYYVIITNTIADNGDGGLKSRSETSNTATVTIHLAGTAVNPFLVTSKEDLYYVGRGTSNPAPVPGGTNYQLWTVSHHYKLMSNITFDDADPNWVPIGSGYANAFSGGFDGNGFTISNLSVSGVDNVGFFGFFYGTVKNLTINNGHVAGRNGVGGIASYVDCGIIENCRFNGSVEGIDGIGGIVGGIVSGTDTIKNNQFNGTVSGRNHVGGIVGQFSGDGIENSKFDGTVYGQRYVGGIAGTNENYGTIKDCTSSGSVIGVNIDSHSSEIGGIAGTNYEGLIENCRFTGTVSGERELGGIAATNNKGSIINCTVSGFVKNIYVNENGYNIGGIIGVNEEGLIQNCKFDGTVIGSNHFGGIVGSNYSSTIKDSTTSGFVTGMSITWEGNVGGIAGTNEDSIIQNCSSSSTISSTGGNLGGIVGENDNGTIDNCHFSGNISGNAYREFVGGIVGAHLYGIIKNCSFTGTIDDFADFLGGIAGISEGTVENCFSSGSIKNKSNSTGGIVGFSAGIVQNCYSIGSVSGFYDVGGIVGFLFMGSIVQNCYSTASVSGDNSVGGVVGYNNNATVQLCVALNKEIITPTSSSSGRVYGTVGAALNNHARSGLPALAGQATLTGRDGQDVASAAYKSQNFWQTTMDFDFNTVWQWNSQTGLPTLRGMGTQNHTAP